MLSLVLCGCRNPETDLVLKEGALTGDVTFFITPLSAVVRFQWGRGRKCHGETRRTIRNPNQTIIETKKLPP